MRLGCRGISLHTLRDTLASHLVMSGVNLNTVQRLLGHSSISTTMVYSHLVDGITTLLRLKKLIQAMSTNYSKDFKEIIGNFIIPTVESFKPEFESNGYSCSYLEQSDSEGISYKLTATQQGLVSYILNFDLKHPEVNWVVCTAKQDKGIVNAFIEQYPLTHLKNESNIKIILKQALIWMRSVR